MRKIDGSKKRHERYKEMTELERQEFMARV